MGYVTPFKRTFMHEILIPAHNVETRVSKKMFSSHGQFSGVGCDTVAVRLSVHNEEVNLKCLKQFNNKEESLVSPQIH